MLKAPVDDEDEKPLDPAVASVERRIRGLMLIAGLTLGLGIFAIFGVILYRIVTADTTPAQSVTQAAADQAADEAAIRGALADWNAAFNAGDADAVCTLFAPDLRSFASGIADEQGYDATCARLKGVVADPDRTFSYALDIREVIITGDTAIVRLTWTLTVRPKAGGAGETIREQGMDFFRRQDDGTWKIARFVSYEE